MLINFSKKNNKPNLGQDENFELVKTLVLDLLKSQSGDIELTRDTKFEDIGFDSIKFINLLLSLEDLINVDLEVLAAEIDPTSIQKISDVVSLVEKLKNKDICEQ
jgi:acyl carrier protein